MYLVPQFTRENAAEMARRGNLARWSRYRPPAQAPAMPVAIAAEGYPTQRLIRVRDQLDIIDQRITEEASKLKGLDGQVLNWLCAAQERLAEQERILAGRPLPGSMRPTRARDERHLSPLTNLEPTLPDPPPPSPALSDQGANDE